jgi:hypothetical protein
VDGVSRDNGPNDGPMSISFETLGNNLGGFYGFYIIWIEASLTFLQVTYLFPELVDAFSTCTSCTCHICSAHFSGASKGIRALTFERPVHPRVSARMQAETASGKAGKAVLSVTGDVCHLYCCLASNSV